MAAVQWEIRRHQVAVAGRVVDAQTGKPLSDVLVTIATGAIRAETRTGGDGHFHFLDLPDGTYPVAATLPAEGSRHGTAQVNAVVSRDGTGRIQMATADLALPATTVRGRVARANNQPVVMAEIVLEGSGEQAFSGADGRYTLVGVEVGARTARVRAQGFQTAVQVVTIASAGTVATLNVTLTPA